MDVFSLPQAFTFCFSLANRLLAFKPKRSIFGIKPTLLNHRNAHGGTFGRRLWASRRIACTRQRTTYTNRKQCVWSEIVEYIFGPLSPTRHLIMYIVAFRYSLSSVKCLHVSICILTVPQRQFGENGKF